MFGIVLTCNLLAWLALVHRSFSKPRESTFHPASYYLFLHGVILTFLPIITYLTGANIVSKVVRVEPRESEWTSVILGSLVVAAALRLALERGYNLKRDHWYIVAICVTSALYVFIAAIAFPFILTALQNDIKYH